MVTRCFPRLVFYTLVASSLFLSERVARARLGEDESQSTARYGEPKPELIGANEAPLLPGAKELAYNHEGWRVRASFLAGKTVRIEYAKIPDASGPKKLTETEVQAVLDAERGTYRWREDKPKTGVAGLNALKTALEGRVWERSDHALARLKLELLLTIESRDVEAYQKRVGKQPAAATPSKAAPATPKF